VFAGRTRTRRRRDGRRGRPPLRLGDDQRDALPDEAHVLVEHAGVGGVVGLDLVLRRGERRRGVLAAEHADDAFRGARVASTRTTRACACGLRTTAAYSSGAGSSPGSMSIV
jgi:hypothetical protein